MIDVTEMGQGKRFGADEKLIKINVDLSMILVVKLYFITEPNEKLFFKIKSRQTKQSSKSTLLLLTNLVWK